MLTYTYLQGHLKVKKTERMVPYYLFNVQGSTFDTRHGGLQDLQWCMSVSVADDHSTEEG